MNRITRIIAAATLCAAGFAVNAGSPAQANELVEVTVSGSGVNAQVDLPTKDVNGWE